MVMYLRSSFLIIPRTILRNRVTSLSIFTMWKRASYFFASPRAKIDATKLSTSLAHTSQ